MKGYINFAAWTAFACGAYLLVGVLKATEPIDLGMNWKIWTFDIIAIGKSFGMLCLVGVNLGGWWTIISNRT